MTQNKWLRFSLFGLLYFTQGTILGYFASLNALYLLDKGIDMAQVGIFASIALIPFMIKILFGMISDRFNFFGLGHRKPYIVLGLAVQFICLLMVANINPGQNFWGFVALAFCLQMGMAFYDTCTDGLALDITPLSEKGVLQGFMVGGRAVGVIAAASLAGLIAESLGWPPVFYFLAGLTLLPFLLLFLIKETERQPGERFNWSAFGAFKNTQVLAAAAVGLIIFWVIVGANQIINPAFSARMELSLSTAGLITTIWGVGVTLGALAGGTIMDRAGDKAALWVSVLSVAPALVLLAVAPNLPLAFITAVIFGVTYGISQAVYFALAMKYTRPAIAASMYAILMAVTNVGQGIGLALSGALAKNAGYPVTFIVFAGIMFLVLPFMPLLFNKNRS
ncbi:MAG TPA: MFS transporter [Anaerolineaceae bacterium]|nr:MFS transporter [Anaerolineaceae bacterium]HPN53810.1 MFS transporter [Anaerolineaceae bacterium]